MRIEKRDGINGCIIISDSRDSDLKSLVEALDFLDMLSQGQEQVAILSDLTEADGDTHARYNRISENLKKRKIKTVFGIGEEMSRLQGLFSDFNANFYQDTETFLDSIDWNEFREMSILVKGSSEFHFEQIVGRLEANSHEAVLEIDLKKLYHNLEYVRSLLKPSTGIMAMVKAFAYGNGISEVAAVLELAGIEYLSVAYADEGVTLRQSGIKCPIMVLNPIPSSYHKMIEHGLEPQISSFRMLEKFSLATDEFPSRVPIRIHIKVNTGMNRLGFDLEEIDALADKLLDLKTKLKVHSVLSHLAASDDKKYDPSTKSQISQFARACNRFKKKGITDFISHILNSGGILRYEDAQLDMVRLGLGLYGLSGNAKFREKLQPIGNLKTVVSQIRIAPKGEGIGYSPKELLEADKRIGIIAIGYADGLPRQLGNGNGRVYINGKNAPFIGNICMDMAMVDLSDIVCIEGDEVEIFGENISIYDLAEKLNTIPYEVLTNISQRVKRVFFKE